MRNTVKLDTLCDITSGIALSRVKPKAEEAPRAQEGAERTGVKTIKVLMSKAISKGIVDVEELAEEEVGEVKPAYLTQAGDVVIKLTTPFDCAYIDEGLEGMLVTSFAGVLRAKPGSEIDMRFLAAYLNAEPSARYLSSVCSGVTSLKTLRKKNLKDMEVPIVPLEKQRLLAKLWELTRRRKDEYLRLIELDRQLFEGELQRTIAKGDE